jgi:methanogenic corrinoid protein MtbC1
VESDRTGAGGVPLEARRRELREALESLDRARVEPVFADALKALAPIQAVESILVPVLARLGDDWCAGKVSLSQIYLTGRICEDLVERLLPVHGGEPAARPRRAIAVLDDYHLLGKRIVLSVLRASGIPILDYGRMQVQPLVERILDDDLEELLISVLMLPSALEVKAVRATLARRGRRVRIAVGGAPFLLDPELWREVGADAFGRSASDAVAIVRSWSPELAR